jgi:hypothetical protein
MIRVKGTDCWVYQSFHYGQHQKPDTCLWRNAGAMMKASRDLKSQQRTCGLEIVLVRTIRFERANRASAVAADEWQHMFIVQPP